MISRTALMRACGVLKRSMSTVAFAPNLRASLSRGSSGATGRSGERRLRGNRWRGELGNDTCRRPSAHRAHAVHLDVVLTYATDARLARRRVRGRASRCRRGDADEIAAVNGEVFHLGRRHRKGALARLRLNDRGFGRHLHRLVLRR